MQTQQSKLPIKGSQRPEISDAKQTGPTDPEKTIKISVYARRNPNPNPELLSRIDKLSVELPNQRQYLNDQEFDNVFGADPDDLDKIAEWAEKNNLTVIEKNASQKRVQLEGTVKDISAALDVVLNQYRHPLLGNYRGRSGYVFIPADLHQIIEGVFGLDTRPLGQSNRRPSRFSSTPWEQLASKEAAVTPANPYRGTFYPSQVAALYNYPAGADGTGQNIAIFSFNGDSPDPHGGYTRAAAKIYFENTLGQKVPNITDVVIQGPGNDPGPGASDYDTTGEVYLDLCIVGALVPGANIYMYFSEFTSQGWVDALHDAVSGKNDIDIISISYGNPETGDSAWTGMNLKVIDQAFEAAMSKGITVCCSSGDNDSLGGVGKAGVEYPASSPNLLSVGGTHLIASANLKSITKETVWNDARRHEGTGGGISVVFTKPSYQDAANVPPSVDTPHLIGRGVPDVAAVGDPNSGVMVMQPDGKTIAPVGGTSASTPLWASLIARLNQSLGANCGFINTLLYTKCANNVLNDIISGNNGAYKAGKGWDACTGLGSPDGEKLLAALK